MEIKDWMVISVKDRAETLLEDIVLSTGVKTFHQGQVINVDWSCHQKKVRWYLYGPTYSVVFVTLTKVRENNLLDLQQITAPWSRIIPLTSNMHSGHSSQLDLSHCS